MNRDDRLASISTSRQAGISKHVCCDIALYAVDRTHAHVSDVYRPGAKDGAFQVYRGIPPEATFFRVKQYLLRLEGFFRCMPQDSLNLKYRVIVGGLRCHGAVEVNCMKELGSCIQAIVRLMRQPYVGCAQHRHRRTGVHGEAHRAGRHV